MLRLFLLGGLIVTLLSGCVVIVPAKPTVGQTPGGKTLWVSIACDVSGSVFPKSPTDDDLRRSYLGPIRELCNTGLRGARVKLYSFFQQIEYLAEVVVEDEDSTWPIIKTKVLEAAIDMTAKGTFFQPVFEQFIVDAKAAGDEPFVGFLLTDGQLFDPKETQKSIKQLAAMNNVKALYVAPVTWKPLRVKTLLAPFGRRVVFATPDDRLRSINDINDILSAVNSGQKGK